MFSMHAYRYGGGTTVVPADKAIHGMTERWFALQLLRLTQCTHHSKHSRSFMAKRSQALCPPAHQWPSHMALLLSGVACSHHAC